jgi:hypothetical protein
MQIPRISTFTRIRSLVAPVAILGVLTPSLGPAIAAQSKPAAPAPTTAKPATPTTTTTTAKPTTTTTTAKPATQTTTAKPAAAAPAQTSVGTAKEPPPHDGGWPRGYTTPTGAALLVYQPQIASWPEQKHATLYAAVSYATKGAKEPALGTVKIESATSVAVDERLVSFSELKIAEPNFPSLPRENVKDVVADIIASVPLSDRVIALERVMANIDTSTIAPKNVEGVKADPPTVFFSQTPAVLMNVDGEPIWSPIAQNDLQSAVNTNWDLFQHTPTKTFYLRSEQSWLTATDVKGPWGPLTGKLPSDPLVPVPRNRGTRSQDRCAPCYGMRS